MNSEQMLENLSNTKMIMMNCVWSWKMKMLSMKLL